jgi:hypothetical protein
MEYDLRFGIWERLAVAGFVVGVAGLVASVTLPAAYRLIDAVASG